MNAKKTKTQALILEKGLFPKNGFKSWLPNLIDLSDRWQWYSELMHFKRLPDREYPQKTFAPDRGERGLRMIENCMGPFRDVSFNDFLTFLLNRFGHAKYKALPKSIKKKHQEHWLKSFDLEYAVTCDHDFLGEYYQKNELSKGKKKLDACFLTPENLVALKTKITMEGVNIRSFKTVCDPCCGSGRQLLAASNYSLYLFGQDIELTCFLMTLVNGFLFAPQIVCAPPEELKANQENYDLAKTALLASYGFDLFMGEGHSLESHYQELMNYYRLGDPEKVLFHKLPRLIYLMRYFDSVDLKGLSESKKKNLIKAHKTFWKTTFSDKGEK